MKNKKNSKIIKYIDNMNDFYIFLSELDKNHEKFIYRGQSNTNLNKDGKINKDFSEWSLNSSLKREGLKNNGINSIEELIFKTKKSLEHIKNKTDKQKNLNILLEMKHFNIATILIEFTKNIKEALFFAFYNNDFSLYGNSGYINLFKLKIPEKKEIKHTLKIENIEKDSFIYESSKNINSIWNQKSLFILDNKNNLSNFFEIEIIKIDYKIIEQIKKYLERNFINNETIFSNEEGIYKDFVIESEYSKLLNAESLAYLERYEEAIDEYEKIIKMDSKNFYAYNKLGDILIKIGKTTEAKQKFEKANNKIEKMILINSKKFKEYCNWGVILIKLDRFEEAIEKFEKAIEINPIDSYAYFNWGETLIKLDRFEEANVKFEKAIEINPNQFKNEINNNNNNNNNNNENQLIEYKEDFSIDLDTPLENQKIIEKEEEINEIVFKDSEIINNLELSLNNSDENEEIFEINSLDLEENNNLELPLNNLIEAGKDIEDFNKNSSLELSFSDPEKHEEEIEKTNEINPGNFEENVKLGISLSESGEYEEAIKHFEKAIEINYEDSDAYYNWGNTLNKLNRFEEAIEKYEQVIEINPEDSDAYYNWGNTLNKLNRFEEAIEKFEEATNSNPQHFKAFINSGLSLSNLNKYQEAIKKFEKAIEINPEDSKSYINLGLALSNLDKDQEAIEKFEKAININQNDSYAYFNLGNTLNKLNRFEEAIEKFEKSVEINPKHFKAFINLGLTLSSLEKYEESIKKFEKAIEINSNAFNAYINWGLSLSNLGYDEEAIEKYKKAIEINPGAFNAYINWGLSLSNLGYQEAAINKFEKAIEINPKYSEAIEILKNNIIL